jgi:hypothetical protein
VCGIAGYSCWNEYDSRINVALPILALAMENRGRKSWGWTDGGEEIVKSVGTISDGFNPSFFGYKQAALHTRQPTVGDVIKENSHPFKIGNIIGMHNGCVYNHTELQQTYGRDCKVDSEHIFHHLNENISLKDIRAYGAIVFWQDGKLYLGRFNGGDLSLVRTQNAWLFASTKESLKIALQYAGLNDKHVFYKLKEDRLYRIEGDMLYKDRELDFGSYSTVKYGTWERANGFTGGQQGTNYPTQGTASTDLTITRNTPAIIEAANRRLPVHYQPRQPHLVTSSGQPLILPDDKMYKSFTEKVQELVEKALTNTEHQHEADSWTCATCPIKIFDGEKYHITDNADIICMNCAKDRQDELSGGVLTQLPDDMGIVGTYFGTESPQEMECDGCGDKISKDEFFVATKSKDYVCVQCFASGVLTDDEDEVNGNVADDVEDNTAEEISYSAREEERLDLLMEELEEARKEEINPEKIVTMMDAITETVQ